MAVLSSLLKRALPTEVWSGPVLFRFSVGTTTAKQSIQFRLRCHAELSKIDHTFRFVSVEREVADFEESVFTDRERAFC